MLHRFCLILLLMPCLLHAEGLDLRASNADKTSYLSAAFEYSSFKISDGNIKGSGIKIDYLYAFSEKFSLDIYLSTGFGGQTATQASFTGTGAYVYYSLLGNCCLIDRSVYIAGTSILNESNTPSNHFSIGLGADQYLLNGSKSVYSASGVGIGLNYEFDLWKYRAKAGLRYSAMTSNQINIQATFYSLGIVFP